MAIFAGFIAMVATGVVPTVVAGVTAAIAMVATGVMNIRVATRALDTKVFTMIPAGLALGAALEKTGGRRVFGRQLGSRSGRIWKSRHPFGLFPIRRGFDECDQFQGVRRALHADRRRSRPHRSGPARLRRGAVDERELRVRHAHRLSGQSLGHGAGTLPLFGLYPGRRAWLFCSGSLLRPSRTSITVFDPAWPVPRPDLEINPLPRVEARSREGAGLPLVRKRTRIVQLRWRPDPRARHGPAQYSIDVDNHIADLAVGL